MATRPILHDVDGNLLDVGDVFAFADGGGVIEQFTKTRRGVLVKIRYSYTGCPLKKFRSFEDFNRYTYLEPSWFSHGVKLLVKSNPNAVAIDSGTYQDHKDLSSDDKEIISKHIKEIGS